MINRHKYLPVAPGGTVIWHYMSIEHFLYLLNNRLLYFSRVDHLDDKAEVLVSEIEKQYWNNRYTIDIDQWVSLWRKRVFINCWIKSETELSTMWLAYASQGKGVAIKTTVDKLRSSYKGEKAICILDVNYIDYKKQTVQPAGERINTYRFFSTKRIYYEPEHEIRLIYNPPTIEEMDSFQIPVDINTLIEEVRIGPNATDDVYHAIDDLVKLKGCTFQVLQSELLYP